MWTAKIDALCVFLKMNINISMMNILGSTFSPPWINDAFVLSYPSFSHHYLYHFLIIPLVNHICLLSCLLPTTTLPTTLYREIQFPCTIS